MGLWQHQDGCRSGGNYSTSAMAQSGPLPPHPPPPYVPPPYPQVAKYKRDRQQRSGGELRLHGALRVGRTAYESAHSPPGSTGYRSTDAHEAEDACRSARIRSHQRDDPDAGCTNGWLPAGLDCRRRRPDRPASGCRRQSRSPRTPGGCPCRAATIVRCGSP